jgi:GNAT superfamily N-acetyltransferase
MSDATVRLPDGTPVSIRPLTAADGAELRRGLDHLSPRSAYRRFLGTPPSLTSRTLRYLTDVDHVNHEALGAADPTTGHGIGVARFVRDHDDPTHAEIALAIADAWQHRGLGTLLLDALATRARAVGITTLTGLVLADNTGMLKLFDHLGPTRRHDAGAGTMEVEVDLTAIDQK